MTTKVGQHLQKNDQWVFDTVADMKAAKVKTGDSAKTLGYYTAGDGGAGEYTIVAGGTGTDDGGSYHDLANGLQARLRGIDLNVKQFGALLDGSNDKTPVQNFINHTASLGVPTNLFYKTLYVSDISFPDNSTIVSNNTTITRVAGYTGTADLVTINNGVEIQGRLAFDGNGVQVPDSSLCVVAGDGVKVGKLYATNQPTNLTNPSRGISVIGDFFDADEISTNACGYSGLYLVLLGSMQSFKVNKVYSLDNIKGFVVNGNTGATIQEIWCGSIQSRYTGTETISDGILTDTNADNTILSIKHLKIENAFVDGAESNCMKIENVDIFDLGTAVLRNESNSGATRNNIDVKARSFSVNSLDLDWRITCYSKNVVIGKTVIQGALTGVFPVELLDTIFTGTYIQNLKDFACPDSTQTAGFVRVNFGAGQNLFLKVDQLTAPDARPLNTINLPANFYSGDCIYLGNINGYTGRAWTGSTTRDNAIQHQDRVFSSVGIPTTGSYKWGDKVYAWTAAAGGKVGWVATADVADASVDNSALKPFGAIDV